LEHTLLVPPHLHNKIPLEDIFTPLDRCLLDNLSFRNLSINEVREMRDLIYYLIGRTIQCILRQSGKQFINDFAKHVVEASSERINRNYSNCDPVSVISTNWDILLDNALKNYIDSKYHKKAVVDYCCYISSFERHDESVKPGLEMLGMGGFNVKLLKLHGSLNWLQCPRCLRLYVDFHHKISMEQYHHPVNCRHCDEHFHPHPSHRLISNLIMPTFLKDLSNPQYKLMWQNAGVELSEARRIVFIGYSLPYADFEMRQLLSRMVRPDAEIEVVDYGRRGETRIDDTIGRYEVFFGRRRIQFFTDGAEHYVNNNLRRDV